MRLNYVYFENKSCHFSARLIPKRRHAVASHKNCISINTHESRFSKSTERIKSKNISFERLFKCRAAKYLLPVFRTFAPKIPVLFYCIFNFEIALQYLPEFGYPRRKKCFSGTTTSFGSRETYLESLLKVLTGKLSSLCLS